MGIATVLVLLLLCIVAFFGIMRAYAQAWFQAASGPRLSLSCGRRL